MPQNKIYQIWPQRRAHLLTTMSQNILNSLQTFKIERFHILKISLKIPEEKKKSKSWRQQTHCFLAANKWVSLQLSFQWGIHSPDPWDLPHTWRYGNFTHLSFLKSACWLLNLKVSSESSPDHLWQNLTLNLMLLPYPVWFSG